jgi:menaquinol-cytochrome c reductase iron-sulfur subunit
VTKVAENPKDNVHPASPLAEGPGPRSGARRSFLTRLTGGVVGLGALLTSWPFVRSLFPNVLYEPPRRFTVGPPEAFSPGVTFLDAQRVFLFRSANGFHAVSGICTHLGCTVKFAPYKQPKEQTVRGFTIESPGEFLCPCHGSKFHGEGTNYSGPAPRPLQSFHVEISPADGQLVVDLGREVDRDFRLVV